MKIRYKIDKDNQLTIIRAKDTLQPQGKFSLDINNQLTYEVREPLTWRKKNDIPKRISLEGKWEIDKDHNLIFVLHKTQTQHPNQRLFLKTELIEAKANALIFSCETKGRSGTHQIYYLQLKGKWQADKHNRLQFLIKTQPNALTLQGIWQLKQNTLIYTYKKTTLATKKKKVHTLQFNGYWQINKKNRLTYILDAKSDSYFEFKVYLETPSLIGKQGVIKYRIGIGLKRTAIFKTQTISLYGVWKFSRKTGLSLVVDYGQGKLSTISFGAFVRIKEGGKVTLELRSRQGKDLGIRVSFSQRFLKNNAGWFLRAIKESKYPRFEAGLTIPW